MENMPCCIMPKKKVWYKLNPETGELTDVSTPIGFAVYNEEHDLPKPAVPYGIAGWLAGGDQGCPV